MAKKLFTKDNQPVNRKSRKGVPNRSTEEIRTFIQSVVDSNLTHLESDLEKMNPSMRWMILDRLTKYFLPALSKNDTNLTTSDITIKVEYIDTPMNDNGNQDKSS